MDKSAIKKWMKGNLENHRDPKTGEVNATTLVEDWDRSESTGGATLDSNHPAWDIAADLVMQDDEKRLEVY